MTTYRVPVWVEVELDLDDLDGEAEAAKTVDETLQRLWDSDHLVDEPDIPWHFEIEPSPEVERVD